MSRRNDDGTTLSHPGRHHDPAPGGPGSTGPRRVLVLVAGVVAAVAAVFGGRTLLDVAGAALLG